MIYLNYLGGDKWYQNFQKGAKFYLVGGCVRDHLMGKDFNDKDFVVITKLSYDDLCDEIRKIGDIFDIPNMKKHLTIKCKINGEIIDIAFPRIDGDYSDHRRADNVSRAKTLKKDASRRDFTINALYEDEKGKIIDYFNGQEDIKKGIIRTVGEPKERFKEDYLRILRALRFSIQLGFKIDPEVKNNIFYYSNELNNISTDRIRDELNKCLKLDLLKTIEYIAYFNLDRVLKYHKLNLILTNRRL